MSVYSADTLCTMARVCMTAEKTEAVASERPAMNGGLQCVCSDCSGRNWQSLLSNTDYCIGSLGMQVDLQSCRELQRTLHRTYKASVS